MQLLLVKNWGYLSPEIGGNDREYSAKGNQHPPINGVKGTLKGHSPNIDHYNRANTGQEEKWIFSKTPAS
jgi:hypothetical protein